MRVALPVADLGFTVDVIMVQCPASAPAMGFAGAARGFGDVQTQAPESDAREFLEDLIRRGRLDVGAHAKGATRMAPNPRRHTHELTADNGNVVLQRRRIDCGFRNHDHTP